jgi:hypothetical protein
MICQAGFGKKDENRPSAIAYGPETAAEGI